MKTEMWKVLFWLVWLLQKEKSLSLQPYFFEAEEHWECLSNTPVTSASLPSPFPPVGKTLTKSYLSLHHHVLCTRKPHTTEDLTMTLFSNSPALCYAIAFIFIFFQELTGWSPREEQKGPRLDIHRNFVIYQPCWVYMFSHFCLSQ